MWLNLFPVRYFELDRDGVRIRPQKGKLLMAVFLRICSFKFTFAV